MITPILSTLLALAFLLPVPQRRHDEPGAPTSSCSADFVDCLFGVTEACRVLCPPGVRAHCHPGACRFGFPVQPICHCGACP